MSRTEEELDEVLANDEDDDSAGEEEGAGEDDSQASDGSQASSAAGGGKKKKKKKKKGKKKAGVDNGNGSADGAAPAASKVDKAEADRRFNAALAAIKAEDFWVELGSSNLQDGKVKKLLEQLKKNDSVTSLNLSQNCLTDEGAQAIAATLGIDSTVPGLITLDLRENNFTPQGITVLEGLKKVRRNLSVMTGAIIIQPEVVAPAGKAGAAGQDKAMRDISDSRLVRKYFQVGNEDDDDSSNGPHVASDPSIDPIDLWQQLDSAVAQGTSGIPTQSVLLKQLCQQVSSELGSISEGEYLKNISSCPHVKACLERLHTLASILDLTPAPVVVQYHKQPQAAVGSHRVFAAETVASLVASQNTIIDQQLVAAKLVPRVLHLAVGHPLCSALHARALKLIRGGLSSKVDDLLGPIMAVSGWGMGLQEPAAGLPDGLANGELCRPLPLILASRGEAALGVVSGSRDAMMGFVIDASKLLSAAVRAAEDPDSDDDEDDTQCNAVLKRALQASSGWCDFAQPESGVLARLAKEQEGDLGGPRAVRMLNHLEGPDMAELAGGGLITGQEILALLQGMSGMSSS